MKLGGISLSAAIVGLALLATAPARATTMTWDISGNLGSNAFSGDISLDVTAGQAISGTGHFSYLSFFNVSMVLITPTTSGNNPTSYGPIGYRSNGGTDLMGLNTNIPIDSAGLLFDVNTTSPASGQFPLFNLASGPGNSTFFGIVDGIHYYNVTGTAEITATPLPAALPLFAGGLGALGLLGWRRKRKPSAAVAA